ncbi:MAG: hypothetical protein CME59_02505 [Halioglobus sp.]|nr:hypothetical protein [Halioglobus sp.]
MQRSSRKHPSPVLLLAIGAMLLGNPASADLISLVFEVEVDQRETYDDIYGLGDSDRWVVDNGYSGDAFTLEFTVDTDTLDPSTGFAYAQAETGISEAPTTPLDAYLDAVLTRWPALGYDNGLSRLSTSATSFFPETYVTDFAVRYTGSARNDPDLFAATDLANRSLYLFASQDLQLLAGADIANGYLLTAQDYLDYVQTLVDDAVEFGFQAFAQQTLGDFSDFVNSEAYAEGLRYTGSARLTQVRGVVPVSATGLLLLSGLLVYALFRRSVPAVRA